MTRLADDHALALLTTAEFASLMRVDPKTVARWCAGKLPAAAYIRTPGGHIRIRRAYVAKILGGEVPGIDPEHLEDDAMETAQVAP